MTTDQISPTRVSIYLTDFLQSRKFADYVLKRELPTKKGPRLRLIHLAFNTSLIVSYCRPFTGNKNPEGKIERSPLKELVREVLNEDEQTVHAEVVRRRHSTYAHSESSVHLFPGSTSTSGFPLLMLDPFYSLLTEVETAILRTMTDKWIKYLQERRLEI